MHAPPESDGIQRLDPVFARRCSVERLERDHLHIQTHLLHCCLHVETFVTCASCIRTRACSCRVQRGGESKRGGWQGVGLACGI